MAIAAVDGEDYLLAPAEWSRLHDHEARPLQMLYKPRTRSFPPSRPPFADNLLGLRQTPKSGVRPNFALAME
jgi:hypothetical protein